MERGQFDAFAKRVPLTTLTTWLVELHTANLFGLPYRIFVCALGLIVSMLSVTGVYVWWKKRAASCAGGTNAGVISMRAHLRVDGETMDFDRSAARTGDRSDERTKATACPPSRGRLMARAPRSTNGRPSKQVDALKHNEATRKSIPTAEMESFFRREEDAAPMPPKH